MGHGQGTGGPGGMGQGASLIIKKIENLNIGGQKEAEIWYIFVLLLGVCPDFLLTQRDQMEAKERQAIIEWLSPLNFFLRQQDISKTRQQGLENGCLMTLNSRAGNQILDKFYGALEYLVLGRPFLLEHLTAQAKTKDLGVACIYFNHKETEDSGDSLSWGKPLGSAAQLYEQNIEKKTRPSYEDMQKLLASALIGFMQIYIILDGVDEYPEEQWGRLAKALTNLGLVNLLVMSRPHIAPTTLFPNLVTLEMKANDGDIQSYLIAGKPELHGEISSEICGRVEGMFLLAKLHIEALSIAANVKEVHQALQELPKDLDHTYENTMNRIDAQPSRDRKIARSALTWVVNAQRPLTILELCVALAIEPGSKELDSDNMTDIGIILSVCAGLVIMEKHSSLVRLVHFTAQNYLDRIQTERFPDAHFEITQSLLTYLQFEVCMDEVNYDGDDGAALFQYCQYCLVHAQWCEEQLKDEIVRFLGETCKYHSRRLQKHMAFSSLGLFHLAWLSIPSLGCSLSKSCKNHKSFPRTCSKCPDDQELTVAAYYGHQKICKLLLDKGADVNAQGGYYGNALHIAAYRGHDKIVQVLLDKGADVNAQGGEYGNALYIAASGGHDKIVQVLLDKGADTNAQEGNMEIHSRQQPLKALTRLFRVLLDKGADTNAQGGEYGNALYIAASGGHDKIVQMQIHMEAVGEVEESFQSVGMP
ncbi:hypothetical protein B0H14DRAFT_3136992 [Mycena olivaceomarginata]|nr:hypothetical protein B0H14DRAFT_3136992 [Mycena olivaceomarginata]